MCYRASLFSRVQWIGAFNCFDTKKFFCVTFFQVMRIKDRKKKTESSRKAGKKGRNKNEEV
jgi:hypothetical protein